MKEVMQQMSTAYQQAQKDLQNVDTIIQENARLKSMMADVSAKIMEKNNLTSDDVQWLVPHQANLRIIDATANRMGLSKEKVMINIEKYGNTTAGTLPLCLWDYEKQLKKGDTLILSAFGGGFTWGAIYLKWAYNS
jgi:3-oxoacyl-[acyl-carrier-protein] synthase-3